MQIPSGLLGSLNISVSLVANLIFLLVVIFTAVVSIILFFHWRKYGLSKSAFVFTEIIYLAVVVLLISTAFFRLN